MNVAPKHIGTVDAKRLKNRQKKADAREASLIDPGDVLAAGPGPPTLSTIRPSLTRFCHRNHPQPIPQEVLTLS